MAALEADDLAQGDKHTIGQYALATVLILLSVLAIFPKPALMTGFLFRDPLLLHSLPVSKYAASFLKQGQLPLWCPDIFAGYPLIGDVNVGWFYPLNLAPFLLLPAHVALNVVILLHYVLAGLFTYIYAREIRLGHVGALVSALVFAFNGFLLDYYDTLEALRTMVWLPLILFFIERALAGRRTNAVFAGVALGVCFLGGHAQYAFYVVLATLVYSFFKMFSRPDHLSRRRWLSRVWGTEVLMIVIAVGLFAVQLLPTYELSKLTARGRFTYPEVAGNPEDVFSLFVIARLFFPNFCGGPLDFVQPVYVGVVPGILAVLGLSGARFRARTGLAAIAVLSIFLALGPAAPCYSALLRLMPVARVFKDPLRAVYLLLFAVAIFAGAGASAVVAAHESRVSKRAVWIIYATALGILILVGADVFTRSSLGEAGAAATGRDPEAVSMALQHEAAIHHLAKIDLLNYALFALAFLIVLILARRSRAPQAILRSAVVALVFLTLFASGRTVAACVDAGVLTTEPALAAQMANDGQRFRKFTHPDLTRGLTGFRYLKEIELAGGPRADALWTNEALVGNTGLAWGVASVSGYSVFPLQRFLELTKADPRAPIDPFRHAGYPDFLACRSLRRIFGCSHMVVPDSSGGPSVTRLNDPLPRTYLLTETSSRPLQKPSALDVLLDPRFDPAREVVLGSSRVVSGRPGELTCEAERPGSLRFRTADDQAGGILVTSDCDYPGWRGFADGQDAVVHEANYLFKAVELPQGASTVDLVFDPRSFRYGLSLSLAALAGCACLTFVWMLRPRAA